MAQVLTFPKELEFHLIGDADKNFFLTWLVLFIVGFSLSYLGGQREPVLMKVEDIQKYQAVIYRVKAEPPKPVEKVVEEVAGADAVEEEEPKKVKVPDIHRRGYLIKKERQNG